VNLIENLDLAMPSGSAPKWSKVVP